MVVIGGLGFSRDDATAVPDISLLLLHLIRQER